MSPTYSISLLQAGFCQAISLNVFVTSESRQPLHNTESIESQQFCNLTTKQPYCREAPY